MHTCNLLVGDDVPQIDHYSNTDLLRHGPVRRTQSATDHNPRSLQYLTNKSLHSLRYRFVPMGVHSAPREPLLWYAEVRQL